VQGTAVRPYLGVVIDREPTARAREIGLILHQAAKARNLNGREVAHSLGWSESKVSRIFSGLRPAKLTDVAALAAVCGVKGDELRHVLRLTEHATEQNWLQEYGDHQPTRSRTMADYEQIATRIVHFEATLVPGPLQTFDYVHVQLERQVVVPATEVAGPHVFALPSKPTCVFFVDELALTRTGPGRPVMVQQLHHLLELSGRANVTIRVIPDSVGFHHCWHGFRLLEFEKLKPLVFVAEHTSRQFLQHPDTIEVYGRIIDRLDEVALSEERTREWIALLATSLETSPEGQEEHLLGPRGGGAV
jgi:transcriptional regulator with XRE-family HTH domain